MLNTSSYAAAASHFSSGENDRDRISLSTFMKLIVQIISGSCHTRTRESAPPVAINFPCFEKTMTLILA
jgi:hypothetical protein